MVRRPLTTHFILLTLMGSLLGCGKLNLSADSLQAKSGTGTANENPPTVVDPVHSSTLKVNLNGDSAEKSDDDIKSIFVSISGVELWLKIGNLKKRLLIAENFGHVDLLALQDGNTVNLSSLKIPEGVELQAIRLLLQPDNNVLIRKDGSICQLQVPDNKVRGIKVALKRNVQFIPENQYDLTLGFQAKKSIVQTNHNKCQLKPRLLVAHFIEQDSGGSLKTLTDGDEQNDSDWDDTPEENLPSTSRPQK